MWNDYNLENTPNAITTNNLSMSEDGVNNRFLEQAVVGGERCMEGESVPPNWYDEAPWNQRWPDSTATSQSSGEIHHPHLGFGNLMDTNPLRHNGECDVGNDSHAHLGWTPMLPDAPQAQVQGNGVTHLFQTRSFAYPPEEDAGASHIAVPARDCRLGHRASLRPWCSQAQTIAQPPEAMEGPCHSMNSYWSGRLDNCAEHLFGINGEYAGYNMENDVDTPLGWAPIFPDAPNGPFQSNGATQPLDAQYVPKAGGSHVAASAQYWQRGHEDSLRPWYDETMTISQRRQVADGISCSMNGRSVGRVENHGFTSSSMEGNTGWAVNQDVVYPEVAPVEVTNNGLGPSTSSGGTFHGRGEMVPQEWGQGKLNGSITFQGENWIANQMPGETTETIYGVGNRVAGSNPKNLTTESHDFGATWYATWNAQAATVDVEQLGQSSIPAHHTQGSVVEDSRELISSILTPDGRCNYVSPAGKACLKARNLEDRSQARHWLTCHVAEELRYLISNEVDMTRVTMAQARILTTKAKFIAALAYATWCPNNECQRRSLTQFFIRADELKAHRQSCAPEHNTGLTNQQIDDWAEEFMELCLGARKHESPYFEAVRRILKAS